MRLRPTRRCRHRCAASPINCGRSTATPTTTAQRAPTPRPGRRYETVFKLTVYETEHPVVQVHPLTGERAIVLGSFVRRLLGVNSAESAYLFGMLQDHVTRLENMVRWRWSVGDVVIWDNRATQHKAIDDYGDAPRIVRRVTIDGPVSVGIDGWYGTRRSSATQVTAAA
jgi:alpha-ketoglutarate-dependent sulfate ester dioxygenase